MANQLEACFDFEMASILAAARQWVPTVYYLGRSFWRVPRTTLYLRRLWVRPADTSACLGAAHAAAEPSRPR